MQPIPIARYQPGGDIYATLVNQYGAASASMIAAAAATGDRTQLANAIENAKGIPAASGASTASILMTQLETDPLGAPLAALDSGVSQLFGSSGVQKILIIGTLAAVFYYLILRENNKSGSRPSRRDDNSED